MKTLLLLLGALGLSSCLVPAADGAKVYRSYAGQVYEVTHSELWTRKSGKVIQVPARDLVLLMDADYETFAVKHYPFAVAEGDRFRDWVIRVGNFEYVTILGARTSVRCYDFGEFAGAPAPAALLVTTNEADVRSRERRHVEWLRDQAGAGQAWAQYEYGIRLRDGRGLPADLSQARRWLKQAADQGHVQARATLAESRPPIKPTVTRESSQPIKPR